MSRPVLHPNGSKTVQVSTDKLLADQMEIISEKEISDPSKIWSLSARLFVEKWKKEHPGALE